VGGLRRARLAKATQLGFGNGALMTRRIEPPPPEPSTMERGETKEQPDALLQGLEGSAADDVAQLDTFEEQQQHEAATKVQSVQRGRSQRQKYTSRVAQERLRRRRLPPFLNLYVESTGGSASPLRERTRAAAVDAGVLAQFCGQYDRVDEVDGRKVKGAKVSHYAVRATDALPSGCSLNAARTARFFLPLVLNAPPLRARFAAPR
jgi:hypothetical protein